MNRNGLKIGEFSRLCRVTVRLPTFAKHTKRSRAATPLFINVFNEKIDYNPLNCGLGMLYLWN